jgi:hypothetical protein
MGPTGRVHHVFVNVIAVARSRAFYDWLMPQLGYAGSAARRRYAHPEGARLCSGAPRTR